MTRIKYSLICLFVMVTFSCRDKYEPDVISSPHSYLVVEGVLTVGGPANIKLTRTSKLDTTGFKAELNAQLIVEGKDNTTRTLLHAGGGNYTSPNLNLILNTEYRLRIRTSAGKEYLSEYVTARQTPAIDSIGWKRNEEGVRLYANTHDASDNTRYYRWEYDETWEIRAYYYSQFIYIRSNNTVRPRTPAEMVYIGWKYNSSKSILLGSSARLQSDIIFEAPINFIEKDVERLSIRYSILLRQYALDNQGFEFYEVMKKNTESLGTIFDAQPSEVRGNIKCLNDPNELVIGYVSASSISEKRIFISNSEVAGWRFQEYCPLEEVPNSPDQLLVEFGTGFLIPIEGIYSPTGILVAYSSSYANCVDVTRRGASLVKPPYW